MLEALRYRRSGTCGPDCWPTSTGCDCDSVVARMKLAGAPFGLSGGSVLGGLILTGAIVVGVLAFSGKKRDRGLLHGWLKPKRRKRKRSR